MLTVEEIQTFIDNDMASEQKRQARQGLDYYIGNQDIRRYRMFYYNTDGDLVEDKTRSNVRIAHPFFTELVDQATQYILSGDEPFVKSQDPELQAELDAYFNDNDDFIAELSEAINDCQVKGCAYMYALKGDDGKLTFVCADSLSVVEVEARYAQDKKDHIIYWYIDKVDADGHLIKKLMDWDDTETWYYMQTDDGEIVLDSSVKLNPRPHILYKDENDELYGESFGFVPFFRIDNNKAQMSSLRPIKALIDDYDMMASSLSNNLIDFDNPIFAVKGFEGDNLDELQQNLKTKKVIGVGENGGLETYTIDVPYAARQTKLELDEKNIYRFGMGLNMAGLKDTAATTNIAIKASYSLLDLRSNRLETNIKRFLRSLVKVVLGEINKANKTNYQSSDVWFEFEHSIMSNESEVVSNKKTEAETVQVELNTLLGLDNVIDRETLIRRICKLLDINYDDIDDSRKIDFNAQIEQAEAILRSLSDEQSGETNGTGEPEE